MGGKAFKRKLAHSVAVLFAAWSNFVLLLKCVIAKVLTCTVRLIKKFTFRTIAILSKYAYLRSSSYLPYLKVICNGKMTSPEIIAYR